MSTEESKRPFLVQSDNYCLRKKHILHTANNIVERLFSRAKLALTDHRNRMTPTRVVNVFADQSGFVER
jgi:hypothetical protein